MARESSECKDLQLACWVSRLEEGSLQLTYEAVNSGESDLFVFNRLHTGKTADGTFLIDRNLAFVGIEGATARITKRIPEVPDYVDVYAFDIPCATVLSPGEQFTEPISLSIPLKPFSRYSGVIEFHTPCVVREIAFSLGYFRKADLDPRAIGFAQSSEGKLPWVHVSPFDQLLADAAPVLTKIPAMY
jgi:hypothetical protein